MVIKTKTISEKCVKNLQKAQARKELEQNLQNKKPNSSWKNNRFSLFIQPAPVNNKAEVIAMENHRPQQNRQEPRPQAVLPPLEETPFRAHLYRSSVVGITDERMRQLAEHFVP